MRKGRLGRMLKIAAIGVVAVAAMGLVVMALWNWLIPSIAGAGTINYWQALGLLVLSKILFGGLRSPSGGMHWRRRMGERWEQMTPEQREAFRKGMHGRCGRGGSPVAPEASQGGVAV